MFPVLHEGCRTRRPSAAWRATARTCGQRPVADRRPRSRRTMTGERLGDASAERRRSRVPWIYSSLPRARSRPAMGRLAVRRPRQPARARAASTDSSPGGVTAEADWLSLALPPQERRHVERRHRLELGARARVASAPLGGRRRRRRHLEHRPPRRATSRAPPPPPGAARRSPASTPRRSCRSTGVCAADGARPASAAHRGRSKPVAMTGDLHLALHLRIDDRAEDDVGVLVRGLLDDRPTPR